MNVSSFRKFLAQRAELGEEYFLLPIARSDQLRLKIANCSSCRLKQGRTHVVFGEGSLATRLLLVGEAPGYYEDLSGSPFVGEAGQLLTEILNTLGIKRRDVFITNLVKCRPPENRDPLPDEVLCCSPFLEQQRRMIRPDVLVTLGRHASQYLLKSNAAMSSVRGRVFDMGDYKLLPTFHPAYILRNPAMKKHLYEDIRSAVRLIEQNASRSKIS